MIVSELIYCWSIEYGKRQISSSGESKICASSTRNACSGGDDRRYDSSPLPSHIRRSEMVKGNTEFLILLNIGFFAELKWCKYRSILELGSHNGNSIGSYWKLYHQRNWYRGFDLLLNWKFQPARLIVITALLSMIGPVRHAQIHLAAHPDPRRGRLHWCKDWRQNSLKVHQPQEQWNCH